MYCDKKLQRKSNCHKRHGKRPQPIFPIIYEWNIMTFSNNTFNLATFKLYKRHRGIKTYCVDSIIFHHKDFSTSFIETTQGKAINLQVFILYSNFQEPNNNSQFVRYWNFPFAKLDIYMPLLPMSISWNNILLQDILVKCNAEIIRRQKTNKILNRLHQKQRWFKYWRLALLSLSS